MLRGWACIRSPKNYARRWVDGPRSSTVPHIAAQRYNAGNCLRNCSSLGRSLNTIYGCQVILVMCFGRIELLQRHDLGDDGIGKSVRGGEILNVALRDLLLLGTGVEDHLTVLAAGIGTLAVELGRVVRHAKKHLQQLLV